MTLGVLGGGQLGRMLALAGLPLGLRFKFLEPEAQCPARDVGEVVVGAYDDPAALARFVQGVDVVTYEFENVSAGTARWLSEHVSVFPPGEALAVAQDRVLEKQLFRSLGIGTPEFVAVDSREGLERAVETLGLPAVLKTRRLGYDGKGQYVLRMAEDVGEAWSEVGVGGVKSGGLVLEAFVPFAREVSMLSVRGSGGETAFYPLVQNRHERGILARSDAPAAVGAGGQERYQAACERVLRELDYVGVLAIEFFELADGTFLANEMAPRVHNSGHWTIEGAQASQFENHCRAVAGLPLGSTAARGVSVMLNVIGGEPDMQGLLKLPGVHVHMYGKTPRRGRKLGHVTVCEADVEKAQALALAAEGCLRNVV